MKTCKRCATTKSIDDFEKPTSHYCKPCKEEARRIERKKHAERCRRCREKQRKENEADYLYQDAERCRRYRERKRAEDEEAYKRKQAEWYRQNYKKKREENDEAYFQENVERCRRWRERMRAEDGEEYKRRQDRCGRNSIRTRLRVTKRNAKKRGIPVDMSDDELLAMLKLPCTYCGFLDPRGFGGVDRMNNQEGYTSSNATPCCQRCNMLKMALDPVTFWERCASITHCRTQGRLFSYSRGAWPERPSIPGSFGSYKRRAETKQVPFELTKEAYQEILAKPCSYCQRTGSSGLDRVVPNGAYSPDNVIPACVECNFMRRILSVEDFYAHCQRVAEHMESSLALERVRGWNIPRTTACRQRRVIRGGT